MDKNKKLIIIGDSAFAQISYEYFTYDSDYEVVAFSVEKDYLKDKEMLGLPVIPLEDIEKLYDPENHYVFVATVYKKLNRLRTRLMKECKNKGYKLASYISSHAFVWKNVKIGEHCFIFENNVVQPFVELGNNTVLWSGNHIGHHSKFGDNCFVASHAVVSGFCNIGDNCFIGVNATIINNIKIGSDCIIGAGALVLKDIESGKIVKGKASDVEFLSERTKNSLKE